jgi:hypothetical protein
MRKILVVVIALSLTGCASIHDSQTKTGELEGKLLVEWIEPDKFIFRPDKDNPLTFTRHNKEKITPGLMYTDGGSIPRPLWALRSYSPWGYAPAFIVHDWLFNMKHCKLPGYERYTAEEAAWVMSEIMKTIMEKDAVDKLTLYTMFEAVKSPIAEELWNTGKCQQPAIEIFKFKPKMQYVIEFPY